MSSTVQKETRYEIKFVAQELEYHRLLQWLHKHPACFYGQYQNRQVNNIYFDSHNYHSYNDNILGSSSRAKVRYRWYGSSIQPIQGAFEIKCKRNQFSWKLVYNLNSTLPDLGVNWQELRTAMVKHLPAEAKIWLDFHPIVVLINRYKRKYFICKNDKIRVTLDSDIRVYDQTHHSYPNYYLKTNMPRMFVLEFKFPRYFRNKASQIISDIPIRVSRHSKYISGLRSIGSY